MLVSAVLHSSRYINTRNSFWLNLSHCTLEHTEKDTLEHRFASQQAPVTHRNRWWSKGPREEYRTEKSRQFAAKQLHSSSTVTGCQPITISRKRLEGPHTQPGPYVHTRRQRSLTYKKKKYWEMPIGRENQHSVLTRQWFWSDIAAIYSFECCRTS